MARQVDMVEKNEGDRIDHRADKADHGRNQNQRAGFVELYCDRRSHSQKQQEKQIPLTVSKLVRLRKETINAVSVNSAYGIDGGEPGIREESGGDDEKQYSSPRHPS